MSISERQFIDSHDRMPFIESLDLTNILGEPATRVRRGLTQLPSGGTATRVSYGSNQLPSTRKCRPLARGSGEAAWIPDHSMPSDFARGLPHVQGMTHAAHPQGAGGRPNLRPVRDPASRCPRILI